jgi:hypothetical protein
MLTYRPSVIPLEHLGHAVQHGVNIAQAQHTPAFLISSSSPDLGQPTGFFPTDPNP